MNDFYCLPSRGLQRFFQRILLISLISAGFVIESLAQKKYILLLSNGKSGINMDNGTRVLPPVFDQLGWSDGKFEVVNGVTGFQNNGSWGMISVKGDIIIRAGFHTLEYAGYGLVVASVKHENGSEKFGCIDLSGKTLIPFDFEGVKIFRDRVILAVSEGNHLRYGVSDIRFNTLISREWRSITPVHDQYFLVENNKAQKAVFDINGNRKTSFMTDSVRLLNNGKLIFFQGPMAGLIDLRKNDPQNAKYKSVRVSGEGKTEFLRFNKWVLLNADNMVIDGIEADSIRQVPDGSLRIYRNGFTAVISADFNEPEADAFKPSGRITGKPVVKMGTGGLGIADENGTWLLRPEYDKIEWDGHIAVVILKYADGTTETRICRPLSDGWVSSAYESVKKTSDFFL
ncbi:MAG: WG repeat-containing protein, partial [Cyclobacteriaceae bacterium]